MITTVSLRDALLGAAKEVFETMVFMAMEEAPPEDCGFESQRSPCSAGAGGFVPARRETNPQSSIRHLQSVDPPSEATLLGSITFKGSLEGCLGVCCTTACARTIAANMLGLDPEELCSGEGPGGVGDDDISDAIGEVANMVMGAVKSRIQDEAGTIEVSIPSVVQGRELKNSLGEGAARVTVTANIEEEYRAEFSLLYREGAGA